MDELDDGTGDPESPDEFNDGSGAGGPNEAQTVQNNGNTGNAYLNNQTPWDIADNGVVASNGKQSSYTPPNWLAGVQSAFGGIAQTATKVAPIINGKPATSPANPGDKAGPKGLVTPKSLQGAFANPLVLVAVAAVGVWFVFLRRK